MTRIAILGAAGRMGGALIRCAQRFEQLKIVAAIEQPGAAAMGEDAGLLAGIGKAGLPITDQLAAANAADIMIDFTFHTAIREHLDYAVKAGKGLVIGTTGLTPEEGQAVSKAAAAIPVVWAPNMSLGVNLLFALVEQTARVLGCNYDVEIVETHHHFKKDAPSGTALRLGEKAAAARNQDFKSVVCYGRSGMVGERPRGEIGIHAVRAGDVVGDHTVMFTTEGERIELSHRASSRDAFAIGALRASGWLNGRMPGLYDMKDVLGL